MIRLLLFLGLASALSAYAFWIYLRVDLSIVGARRLAVVRSVVLVIVLALLFDPRLPSGAPGGVSSRWVLLDASLSMANADQAGRSAWTAASERAGELGTDGWNVVRFGGTTLEPVEDDPGSPDRLSSMLAPALSAAAEAGAREVRVLSDMRFEDAVALRSAIESIPVTVTFEQFGDARASAGIGRFAVPDVLQPDGTPVAEIEVFGGLEGDSIEVVVFEEGQEVATRWVPAAAPGYQTAVSIDLPTASASGQVRYTAALRGSPDGFLDDEQDVAYANIGHQAGALVLISFAPDWEPRFLLPVLEEVTGLPAAGYLRAGADRYVRLGIAADRGPPADSAAVRRAAADAAVLVVHGVGADADAWITELMAGPGRRLVLPADAAGARLAGLETAAARAGEWYASPDVPTSPIAGALAGVPLQGLPPLTNVLVPVTPTREPPLQLQLAGTGTPESAFSLLDRSSGRVAVALASGYWRWAMRDNGREPYRRLWSGLVGWLLADQQVASPEARPTRWVVERGASVEWAIPDTAASHIQVLAGDSIVVDTTVTGGGLVATGVLPPSPYSYTVTDADGDTISSGRFDVTPATTEMLPPARQPELPVRTASIGDSEDGLGRPLRTSPWPYLLVIALLCGEWVVRRRSGLR